jgi:hypothetical protein
MSPFEAEETPVTQFIAVDQRDGNIHIAGHEVPVAGLGDQPPPAAYPPPDALTHLGDAAYPPVPEHTGDPDVPDPAPGDPAGDPAGDDADVSTVIGTGSILTLSGGMRVRLRPLGTREFFRLFSIITTGLGAAVMEMVEMRLDPDEPTEQFVGKFAMLLLTALPEAEDKTIAFLRGVVEPEGLVVDGKPNKADQDRNAALKARLDALMDNPDPMDTITIVEALAHRDAADLQALGKRLARAVNLAKLTGQIRRSR